LFQIFLVTSVEETYSSPKRISSLLEAGASDTLFPCENIGSFLKEYFLQLEVKVEIGSFSSK
jgi:hypothetical protein